jgi:hypothetical protein
LNQVVDYISPFILEIGHRHDVVQNKQSRGEGGGVVEDKEQWFEVHGSMNGAKLAQKVSPLPLRDLRLSGSFMKENDSWHVLIPSLPNAAMMTLIWWRFFHPLWFFGGSDV